MSKAKYSKMIKIVYIILMVCMLLSVTNRVFAQGFGPSDIKGDPSAGSGDIKTIGNTIVGIVSNVGIVVSVLILVILGIKYMIGSAQEKAEYKKTMIPYLIGAILLFAASTIASIVKGVAESFTSSK